MVKLENENGATTTLTYGAGFSDAHIRLMAPGIAGKSELKSKPKGEMTEWESEMAEVKRGLAERRRVT
ncbi:hypothetical protein [Paenibacillus sp. P22]|uniref:hypothetical protein n=1 Tax=Paenibacillus sp. P22 TaxID=483908 RepID=UPI00041BF660|nr:hypothetical protein [Paenibacillus sp. P22]